MKNSITKLFQSTKTTLLWPGSSSSPPSPPSSSSSPPSLPPSTPPGPPGLHCCSRARHRRPRLRRCRRHRRHLCRRHRRLHRDYIASVAGAVSVATVSAVIVNTNKTYLKKHITRNTTCNLSPATHGRRWRLPRRRLRHLDIGITVAGVTVTLKIFVDLLTSCAPSAGMLDFGRLRRRSLHRRRCLIGVVFILIHFTVLTILTLAFILTLPTPPLSNRQPTPHHCTSSRHDRHHQNNEKLLKNQKGAILNKENPVSGRRKSVQYQPEERKSKTENITAGTTSTVVRSQTPTTTSSLLPDGGFERFPAAILASEPQQCSLGGLEQLRDGILHRSGLISSR